MNTRLPHPDTGRKPLENKHHTHRRAGRLGRRRPYFWCQHALGETVCGRPVGVATGWFAVSGQWRRLAGFAPHARPGLAQPGLGVANGPGFGAPLPAAGWRAPPC